MTAIAVRLAALIAVFVSVFLISQLVLSSTMNRRAEKQAINKRLQLLRSGVSRETIASILRNNMPGRLSENAGPLERLTFAFKRMVGNAGLSSSPGTVFIAMMVGFALLLCLLSLLFWINGIAFTGGVLELVLGLSAAIAIGLPWMVLSQMAQRRRKRMQEQFPLALDVFTRSLKVGHPIATAIQLLTEEVEDPLGSEFGLIADEIAYGANLSDALLAFADRWDIEDIKMFVVCVAVQSETGGNLAEILENLSVVIRERASLYLKVRALSSEGRMSGWMLTALPILTFISVFMSSPSFYLNVADDPIFIYGFSSLIILYFIGVIVIRRMVDLKV